MGCEEEEVVNCVCEVCVCVCVYEVCVGKGGVLCGFVLC